jgi:hypothetical protein
MLVAAKMLYPLQDSNLRPSTPEVDALSTELKGLDGQPINDTVARCDYD